MVRGIEVQLSLSTISTNVTEPFTREINLTDQSWNIECFENATGNQPVKTWFATLNQGLRHRVMARILLLAKHGPTLDYPYTSRIEGKLREIRIRYRKESCRILYYFDETRTGVLLHAFGKTEAAVEEVDRQIGIARMITHAGILRSETKEWRGYLWRGSQVVRQGSAKPPSAVRFRSAPPVL